MPRKRPDRKVDLNLLTTEVPGLDQTLGGGLPALSFNLIAGGPGTGKTTLSMQMLFANATAERPGLFFTLLGETSLKMLRYQQQLAFFDLDRIGRDVHFRNLSQDVLNGDLDGVLQRISEEVERVRPGIVIIDSFRSVARVGGRTEADLDLERFVQRLSLQLTTWEVTSFLIGEYEEEELRNPVFTVADGILWLSQVADQNSVVRKLQVVKMRGMATMPGLHTLRLTDQGMEVFPRIPEPSATRRSRSGKRLSTGITELDAMTGGGIPVGDSLVLAGPTGSGKTTFALQFVKAGLQKGEPAVIAVFEEHPADYLGRARTMGAAFEAAIKQDRLRLIYLRPLDLSVDETLSEIRRAAAEIGARRLVIDSISGFEIALAPTFRVDFRESLYRLVGSLTALGVTIFSTVEVVERRDVFQLTGYEISFLTDDIIRQRYVEIDGELRKVLTVVKMRGSNHSREFHGYELTAKGVRLGGPLRGYERIMTGMPTAAASGPARPVRPARD